MNKLGISVEFDEHYYGYVVAIVTNGQISDQFFIAHVKNKLNLDHVVDFFLKAIEKGFVSKKRGNYEPISRKEFEWQVFLAENYERVSDIPSLDELKEKYEKFVCSKEKIVQFLVGKKQFSQFDIVFSGQKAEEMLRKYTSVYYPDFFAEFRDDHYTENLEVFTEFEGLLFSVTKVGNVS